MQMYTATEIRHAMRTHLIDLNPAIKTAVNNLIDDSQEMLEFQTVEILKLTEITMRDTGSHHVRYFYSPSKNTPHWITK